MSEDPDACLSGMSLHLSRALDEIGLNSMTVKRRRNAYLVSEQMLTWQERLDEEESTCYHFGSQIEGTTTLGLCSDVDYLVSVDISNVMQDLKEWVRGKANFLMLQENMSPGYCRLQSYRSDKPMARDNLPSKNFIYDDKGRVILKNRTMHPSEELNRERNGPAVSMSWGYGVMDSDYVAAYRCHSWPAQAEEFTRRLRRHGWPSEHLLQEAVQHGVFLVGVGHKQSPPEVELLEWRISASMAERCLMFSFSIVHIKCYVVLKMLVKTFVEPRVGKCISSYHCKTALFHCTEKTEATFWRDDNLIQCVVRCLEMLHAWVTDMFCPNFIIHEENLLAGKVTVQNRGVLQSILKELITRNGHALLEIHLDELGQKLQRKLSTDPSELPVLDSPVTTSLIGFIDYSLHLQIIRTIRSIIFKHVRKEPESCINFVCQKIDLLKDRLRQSGKHERLASRVIMESLSCWLGSLQASAALSENRRIPPDVLQLFPNETNLDIASMEKLASILYCNGDLHKVETILQSVEIPLSSNITMPICGCYITSLWPQLDFLHAVYALKSMKARCKLFAHCVTFAPQEMHCAPSALRYELYRAAGGDMQHRIPEQDRWMDLAVVDCLPYLYFLQYLTFRQLGKKDLQRRSLQNLDRCLGEDHYFQHLETALNLLGQCYELELKPDAAIACYRTSLEKRPRNNAAKWHIAILCYRLVQHRWVCPQR